MKDSMSIVMGVVLTVVALAMVVTSTFMPFKANQQMLASTNTSLMSSLQAEIDGSVSSDVSKVTGSAIQSLINSSVSNSNIEIYVGGTKWDGKTYSSSNISVNSSDTYTRSIAVDGSKTKYTFTKA